MFTVQGVVATVETGQGVPNLQVVLYDIDPLAGQQTNNQSTSEVPAGANIDAVWQTISGDRLGSVLTDSAGRFKLQFEAVDFASLEKNPRPELMLCVVAPDDVDANGPFALPVTSRLLYMARDIRINAGRLESYYIRLPREKLARYGIDPVRVPTGGEPAAQFIQKSLAVAAERERVAQAAAAEALQPKFAQFTLEANRTKQAFTAFTLAPRKRGVRDERLVLQKGESLATKTATLATQRITDIIARESDRTRRFTLRVPESVLRDWGLSIGADGALSGAVPHRRLLAWYRARRAGVALDSDQSWMRVYCQRMDAWQKFDDTVERCARGPADPAEPPTPEELEAGVDQRVHDQLATQTTPEQHLNYGVAKGDSQLSAIIHAGAADVTAYHDFAEIHIAFEHVWSESVDRSLRPFLMGAYREMVRYQNQVSGSADFPDVSDVDDMRELYNEFKALQRALEEANAPAPVTRAARLPLPASVRELAPTLTVDEWSAMSAADRAQLLALAEEFMRAKDYGVGDVAAAALTLGVSVAANESRLGQIRAESAQLVQRAREALRERSRETAQAGRGSRRPVAGNGSRLSALMAELDERLAEPYRFDVFAPDSTNYGVMLTYRQAWEPRDYQVGELISTIPLAPKEVRRYTSKQVVRRNRLQKELDDLQTSNTAEHMDTSRADSEIVRQARNRTSFEQTASATVNVGMFQGEFGTRFGVEAEKNSSDTKRNFREAVARAAEEYKRQRRLEIETTDSTETEFTDGGEITNPNDEITVTYLFYELQRQYLLSERLHRLTPVVMVAREVPSPDEIDIDWLLAHDWILRRALLDDTQVPALNYLTTSIAGDELALESMRESMQRQIDLVEELTRKERMQTDLSERAFNELKRLMGSASTPDDAQKMKDISLALVFGPFSLAGGNGDDRAAEKREEIAKFALERADKSKQEASARLTREVTAMQDSVERYTKALQMHFDRMAAIARLRVHVKENILHYMQAIWDHEPTDQRFFALYNLEVPWIVEADRDVEVRIGGRRLAPSEILLESDRTLGIWYEVTGGLPLGSGLAGGSPSLQRTTRKLSDVANLDQILGYKGNYQIFPLRETNYLHDYMMQDYVDPATGKLRDPDATASPTTDEILDYVCCLRRHEPERLDEEREQLLSLIESRLEGSRPEKELILVPSRSLYIEALPGKHPIMEDFKLTHRALDVKKVQAEVRKLELENLRYAKRILRDETGDPEIEKSVLVSGNLGSGGRDA